MKKMISVFVVTVLLLTTACSYAENSQPFDYHVLEGAEGYQYDKFEKLWKYTSDLMLQNDETMGIVAVLATGNDKSNVAVIRFGVLKNSKVQTCNKAMILLGEEIITIESINARGGYNYFMLEDKEIFSKIVNAESISIRLTVDKTNYDFEVAGNEMKLFGQKMKLLIENNFFEAMDLREDQAVSMFTVE